MTKLICSASKTVHAVSFRKMFLFSNKRLRNISTTIHIVDELIKLQQQTIFSDECCKTEIFPQSLEETSWLKASAAFNLINHYFACSLSLVAAYDLA